MALNHGPEQHYEDIPQKDEAKDTLSKGERMLKNALRENLNEVRKGLGSLGEEIENQAALNNLSPEQEAEELANNTLKESAEWNARRTDAVLTRKVMNQSMEKVLNSTETEIKQRRLGLQRSRFNI